ncbi:MAG: hypothetical protein GY938_04145 [Ketobacter sp.]|nr:hypothetical protein [Ketobacter sp.]
MLRIANPVGEKKIMFDMLNITKEMIAHQVRTLIDDLFEAGAHEELENIAQEIRERLNARKS